MALLASVTFILISMNAIILADRVARIAWKIAHIGCNKEISPVETSEVIKAIESACELMKDAMPSITEGNPSEPSIRQILPEPLATYEIPDNDSVVSDNTTIRRYMKKSYEETIEPKTIKKEMDA